MMVQFKRHVGSERKDPEEAEGQSNICGRFAS